MIKSQQHHVTFICDDPALVETGYFGLGKICRNDGNSFLNQSIERCIETVDTPENGSIYFVGFYSGREFWSAMKGH